MRVSVVVCTYDAEMYDHLVDAIESVLNQTHDDLELLVVVDGNEELYDRVRVDYGSADRITLLRNERNLGLSASRNEAIEVASGEVVAFLDDDAVANRDWIEELVSAYASTDAIAVGGRMVGDWVDGEPDFLPEEFYWLVGVTHRGFASPGEEVRNTFGSNISFERRVLTELGGFRPDVGRHGEKPLQAEEPELGLRMRARFGRGVYYHPAAVVRHKVFGWRLRKSWPLRRAFWQGYSKRVVEAEEPAGDGAESAYLRQLLVRFIPERLGRLVTDFTLIELKQLLAIVLLTACVGLGYCYGVVDEVIRAGGGHRSVNDTNIEGSEGRDGS